MSDYTKRSDEDDYSYGLRLIETKVEQKPMDLTWKDIVDLLKLDIHEDTLRKSAATSPFSGYNVMQYYKKKIISGNASVEEMNKKIQELYKATINARDERNELNRLKRDEVRSARLFNTFRDIIKAEVKPCEFQNTRLKPVVVTELGNDMIVTLSDMHYGEEFSNAFNNYSPTIAEKRLGKYYERIKEIKKTHKVTNAYLFLGGDLINGTIHTTVRLSNCKDVIEQVKGVSILITNFVYSLSKIFNRVFVYSVHGNHSRIFPKKEDNQVNEYLDNLIPFYLHAALQNVDNIHVHWDDTYKGDMCNFVVRGHRVAGVHGDRDSVQTVTNNVRKITGTNPDIILMGHRHRNAMSTIDNIKVIESGCFNGVNDYCIEKRLVGLPEQVVLIVNEDKCIECLYDIQLI